MKSVLISIRPQWVEKIASGQKTIEVRKSAPKEVPFKAYIYCTKGKPYLYRVDDDDNFELARTLRSKVDGYVKDYNEQNGKVIGEFICDGIAEFEGEFHDDGSTEELRRVWYDEDDGERDAELFAENGEQNYLCTSSCLTWDELKKYIGIGYHTFYGLHISDLKIYDKPRELSDFLKPCPDTFHYCTICKHCVKIIPPDEEEYALYHGGQYDYWEEHCTNRLTSPPQSWRYVEDLREE